MEVTGNAETIYFNRDTVKNVVTELAHTVGNTIKAVFKNGQLSNTKFYGNTETKANPINKVKDDDKILKAFIWKPKERPQTKEDITGAGNKPKATATAVKPSDKKGAPLTGGANKSNVKETAAKSADKAATTSAKGDTAPPKPVTYETIISN
jgi:hypothetical protein